MAKARCMVGMTKDIRWDVGLPRLATWMLGTPLILVQKVVDVDCGRWGHWRGCGPSMVALTEQGVASEPLRFVRRARCPNTLEEWRNNTFGVVGGGAGWGGSKCRPALRVRVLRVRGSNG